MFKRDRQKQSERAGKVLKHTCALSHRKPRQETKSKESTSPTHKQANGGRSYNMHFVFLLLSILYKNLWKVFHSHKGCNCLPLSRALPYAYVSCCSSAWLDTFVILFASYNFFCKSSILLLLKAALTAIKIWFNKL